MPRGCRPWGHPASALPDVPPSPNDAVRAARAVFLFRHVMFEMHWGQWPRWQIGVGLPSASWRHASRCVFSSPPARVIRRPLLRADAFRARFSGEHKPDLTQSQSLTFSAGRKARIANAFPLICARQHSWALPFAVLLSLTGAIAFRRSRTHLPFVPRSRTQPQRTFSRRVARSDHRLAGRSFSASALRCRGYEATGRGSWALAPQGCRTGVIVRSIM